MGFEPALLRLKDSLTTPSKSIDMFAFLGAVEVKRKPEQYKIQELLSQKFPVVKVFITFLAASYSLVT